MATPLRTGPPPRDRRSFVLHRLRQDEFVSYRTLAALGVPMPLLHVESLRGEGHVIADDFANVDEAGRPDRGWRLVKDAWANATTAATFAGGCSNTMATREA